MYRAPCVLGLWNIRHELDTEGVCHYPVGMSATLTEAEIAEFQALYKKHFGIELTSAMALDKGYRLTKLVEVVLKNSVDMPEPETETISKNDE